MSFILIVKNKYELNIKLHLIFSVGFSYVWIIVFQIHFNEYQLFRNITNYME